MLKYVATLVMIGIVFLSGCASHLDKMSCGTVSNYLEPDAAKHLYRVIVTHLDGKPVISKPNYKLTPGVYKFTVVELVNSPKLKVKLAARGTKVLTVKVEANQRYHLAAKFNIDKVYTDNDTGFWEPEVWRQESHQCEIIDQK